MVLHWTSQDMQRTFPLQQVARGEGLLAAQRGTSLSTRHSMLALRLWLRDENLGFDHHGYIDMREEECRA